MRSLLALTPTLEPYTGWGRYSRAVVDTLGSEYQITVATDLPDPVSLRSEPRSVLRHAVRLRRRLGGHDAVFSLVAYPYSLVARLATLGTGTPYFVSCHGTYAVAPLHDKHRLPARWALSGAKQLFPVSHYTADRLTRAVPSLTNITIVPNGVEIAEFDPATPFDLDHRVLLTVGPFKQRKGQRESMRAFTGAAEAVSDVHYHFVGGNTDSDYCRSVRQIARDAGIDDRVHFQGYVPDDTLERWYATADVSVLTPQYVGNHFEGFGLVYLEANRYGVPAVGVRDSGAVDAIDHGRSGLCVDNDVDSVATALERLFTEDDYYSQLSRGATEWARENDWSKTLRPMLKSIGNG